MVPILGLCLMRHNQVHVVGTMSTVRQHAAIRMRPPFPSAKLVAEFPFVLRNPFQIPTPLLLAMTRMIWHRFVAMDGDGESRNGHELFTRHSTTPRSAIPTIALSLIVKRRIAFAQTLLNDFSLAARILWDPRAWSLFRLCCTHHFKITISMV